MRLRAGSKPCLGITCSVGLRKLAKPSGSGPARSGDIAELAQDKVFWNEKELLAMQNTDELGY